MFFVDFHLLDLFAPTNPIYCLLPHVHEIYVSQIRWPMVFVIAHRALVFPMGNIINININ